MRIALLTFLLLAGLGVAAGNVLPQHETQHEAAALSRAVDNAG